MTWHGMNYLLKSVVLRIESPPGPSTVDIHRRKYSVGPLQHRAKRAAWMGSERDAHKEKGSNYWSRRTPFNTPNPHTVCSSPEPRRPPFSSHSPVIGLLRGGMGAKDGQTSSRPDPHLTIRAIENRDLSGTKAKRSLRATLPLPLQ